MHRARRLVALAVVAVVGMPALAACRSNPDVAAYVGGNTYTQKRVTQVFDDAHDKLVAAVKAQQRPDGAAANQRSPSPTPEVKVPISRQQIVDLLVSLDLGRRVVKKKGYQVREVLSPAQISQGLQLPADTEFVKMWAEWINLAGTIQQNSPAKAPGDAQLKELYRALVAANVLPAGASIEQIRTLAKEPIVQSALAARDALIAEAKTVDTRVNPQYEPLRAPMLITTQNGTSVYELAYIPGPDTVIEMSPRP